MATSIGFVFPGQGSQSVGMLGEFLDEYSDYKTIFEQASDVLGYDLLKLTQSGPAEKLNITEFTQPALLAAGFALWSILQKRVALTPAYFAGHSLGEYTALVAAGAMSFEDGLRCVAARGRAMQAAVAPGVGAMAAIIGLDTIAVAEVCEQAQGVVTPANLNSPAQIVIAGEAKAVEHAMILAKDAGAKLAKQIPVSVPSHCALMQPAADEMKDVLSAIDIKVPSTPVIQNVDASSHESPESIRQALIKQLTEPVRWVDCIRAIQAQGVNHFVECGPGKVLSGLIKRIDRACTLTSLSDKSIFETFVADCAATCES